jgi:hypothetical protein
VLNGRRSQWDRSISINARCQASFDRKIRLGNVGAHKPIFPDDRGVARGALCAGGALAHNAAAYELAARRATGRLRKAP